MPRLERVDNVQTNKASKNEYVPLPRPPLGRPTARVSSQRVCTPCKHTLELEDWRERVEWRLERVNAYLEDRLIQYFDTGVVSETRRVLSTNWLTVPFGWSRGGSRLRDESGRSYGVD